MRRDVCYFLPADLVTVYDGFATALKRGDFISGDKNGFEPYHTIGYALKSSFKYNMNGGACTIHFMPYKNGTAVDLRFSVVQLAGARYGAYAKELMKLVSEVTGISAEEYDINIEEFLKPQNKIIPAMLNTLDNSVLTPQSSQLCSNWQMKTDSFETKLLVCEGCGKILTPDDRFCSYCGTKAKENKRFCRACGKEIVRNGSFCAFCGSKCE